MDELDDNERRNLLRFVNICCDDLQAARERKATDVDAYEKRLKRSTDFARSLFKVLPGGKVDPAPSSVRKPAPANNG